ncbi:hypothetical protein [Streptomyces sp. NPDC051286]|uniref:hypothetical protein n=1 Tax=Streptomyces sp. NPDC051286 TaxID=3365647 RepID=UPI0037A42771
MTALDSVAMISPSASKLSYTDSMLLSDFVFPGSCSLSAIFFHLPVTCERPLGSRGTHPGQCPYDRQRPTRISRRQRTGRRRDDPTRKLTEPAGAFTPVVETARAGIADASDTTQLHSAYLYGSIPRGTAIPGVSDRDLLPALLIDNPAPWPAAEYVAVHGEKAPRP